MDKRKVDVAIIGSGTAGLAAYRAARLHTDQVLLIEGGAYGTTCARVGCMPSKLLLAAADAAHAVSKAGEFGVNAAVIEIDGPAVMQRVQFERDRFVDFVLDSVDQIPANEKLNGHARFLSAQVLQVGDHTQVEAGRIVIATGSSPNLPDSLAHLGSRLLTNEDVFDWADLPESIAVIGTGAIGLELGQGLQRLGVRTTLVGRSENVGQLRDAQVLAAAQECFGRELDLRLNTEISSAVLEDNGVTLRLRHTQTGEEQTAHYTYVLAATGRSPNLQGLDLDKAGLVLDKKGVPRFDRLTMRCGDSTVFIAGDVSAERAILHEAADQGRIAGENAGTYPQAVPGLRHPALTIAFTDPQIASVGQSFPSLKAGSFVAGTVAFANQGRSRVMAQNCGVLRVYADNATGRFLGAEMVGPRAEHLAHLLAWACQSGMTIGQMLKMPFYHPVVEEGLRTALRDARDQLPGGLPEIDHCTDATPGM